MYIGSINQSNLIYTHNTEKKRLVQNTYALLVSKIAEFQHEEERLDYLNNQKLHNDHHIGIYQSEGYGFNSCPVSSIYICSEISRSLSEAKYGGQWRP